MFATSSTNSLMSSALASETATPTKKHNSRPVNSVPTPRPRNSVRHPNMQPVDLEGADPQTIVSEKDVVRKPLRVVATSPTSGHHSAPSPSSAHQPKLHLPCSDSQPVPTPPTTTSRRCQSLVTSSVTDHAVTNTMTNAMTNAMTNTVTNAMTNAMTNVSPKTVNTAKSQLGGNRNISQLSTPSVFNPKPLAALPPAPANIPHSKSHALRQQHYPTVYHQVGQGDGALHATQYGRTHPSFNNHDSTDAALPPPRKCSKPSE